MRAGLPGRTPAGIRTGEGPGDSPFGRGGGCRPGALSRVAGAVLLLGGLVAVPALRAQTPAPSQPQQQQQKQKSLLKRFSFGGRVSVLAMQTMNEEDTSSSTSEPPLQTTSIVSPSASRIGGGLTMEFAIKDNIGLGVDVIYRQAGFKQIHEVVGGTDDPATPEDDRIYTRSYARTRGNYWDVPVVARFYSGGVDSGVRAFVGGGMAMRHVSSIRSFRETLYWSGENEVDETPVKPANSTIFGVVVGGGFELRSSAGLKVMPEVRYTYWLERTFDAPPVQSKKSQIEFLLGFTF